METVKPARLHSRLRAVHVRGQLRGLLMGGMALLKWAVIVFVAAVSVDWLVHLPALVRVVVLGLLLGVSFRKAWRAGLRHLRSYSPVRSALMVEERYDGLESILVTGVQFSEGGHLPGTSKAMCEVTVRSAEEAAAPLRPDAVVPFGEMKRPAGISALLLAGICVFAIVNAPLLAAGLARIFTPWRAVAYPTRTHIELDGREIVVREGQGVRILARLSGEVPESAVLAIRTGKGSPRKRALEVVDDACVYMIGAAFRSFDYYVKAGDACTDWHTVRVISSPRVTETRIRLVYPSYMNRPDETMESMTLTVPEGVGMEWTLRLDRPVNDPSFSIEGGEPIPLSISDDGLTVEHTMDAAASGAYWFSWIDREHDFSFDTAKHYLQVAPDQVPQVEFTSPQRNLFATVGRKLTLSYRANDDHGIGESKIVHRHCNAEEKAVPFTPRASKDRSVHVLDWDYRKALKGVDVGDTVSFAIEVSDRYPGPDGPHRVRSETRRLTFLSREDYLKKVYEMRARLLSQLRSIYRQERAAYDVIKGLDPAGDAFEQTCFLESSRQDILAERIMALSRGIRDLVDDLTANGITERAEFEGLSELRSHLGKIRNEHIGKAAALLRDLGPSTESDVQDVLRTAAAINEAARGLSSLVLQLGVREAMEVFARELHVIAGSQSALRVETIESSGKGAALPAKQKELAGWLGGLLTELGARDIYYKAPLLTVRLARMVKDLRDAGIGHRMEAASGLLRSGKVEEAVRLQGEIISDIFELECHIRVGSEYEALLNARELFTFAIGELERMESDGDGASSERSPSARAEMAHSLDMMCRKARLLIMPAIPAPQPRLLARKPTEVPPVDALIASLQDSLRQAARSLRVGRADASRAQRTGAAGALRRLVKTVEARLHEISRTSRYAGASGAAMERSSMIRELLASQMRLTEKTEDAEYDETSGVYLAPSQLHLSKEVLRMRDRLARKSRRESSSSRTVAPMLKMLEKASAAMVKSAPALEANKLGDAIEHQDDALDALQAAMGFANNESNGWLGLANLLMTAEGVAVPARYMRDIVAEQRDLIADTKKSKPEGRARLLAIQKNLGQAVFEVGELVAGTGSGLDFEQAMLFAGSDMGLSAQKLEAGDVQSTLKAQAQATDSVLDLSKQFDASEKQFYYFVKVMECLQGMHTDGVVVLDALSRTRMAVENATDDDAGPTAESLSSLLRESEAFSSLLFDATGRKDYTKAHTSLLNALKQLKAGDRDAFLDELTSAEDALKESMDELRELMAHVAYVPSISPVEAPEEYNVMLEMVSLLDRLKGLSVAAYRAKADRLKGALSGLRDAEETIRDLMTDTNRHPFVVNAHKSLSEALALLKRGKRPEAYDELHESTAMLRRCILEYALYYVEIKRPRGSRRKKKGKSSIVKMFKMSNKLKAAYDKNWGGVEGDDPKGGRSEWEVLGRRDRAALNENFVRELPLEYREFLKDYYERLTR